MGKFAKSTFHDVLNRDLNWAYHEIITEALCVLWIGCQLSLKFGTRFFPEWEITRIDPDRYTDLDRLLWLLLGQNITGCVWDDVVSPWKPTIPQTVTNTAASSTARANAGYFGTLAMIIATVLLGVSVICSAWVNRHWRIPRWTQHLRNCRRITTWFGYSTTCKGEDWDFQEDPNVAEWRKYVLNTFLFYAGLSVFVGFWLVFCVLPVVIIAGWTISFIGRHCGEETVFPTTVVCFSLLAVHCTGRIWGLWMNRTYLMQMHEMIRNVTGIRLIFQPFASDESPEIVCKTEKPADHPSPVKRIKWLTTFLLVAIPGFYCVVIHCFELLPALPVVKGWMDSFSVWIHSFWVFSSSASSQNGSTSVPEPYWTYVTCTECCDNYATGMGQKTAMLSYYVDLHYPRWQTTYPALVALFDTVFSPVTERFYVVWMGIVGAVVGLPIILLVMGSSASMFYVFAESRVSEAKSNRKPKEINVDLEEGNEEPTIPERSAVQTSNKPFCVCALWTDCERCIVVTISRVILWTLLPFPVLGLIVPEQFQLPALLLLMSLIEVGLCCFAWKSIGIARRELRERHSEHSRRGKVAPEDDDTPLLTPC
ncbi:uncharacterized protein LOC129596912 [Paramacrobiotus metropolitanus]|uniref:uncharacterized protein LOC129596912 n=1 Tax=Paramacrobiotus metropolitanus TaxID=2943436 RepID=UPI0024457101|nr:uncharacterized protein LOC129596912 [Paramacrobiotus metropolitanus]